MYIFLTITLISNKPDVCFNIYFDGTRKLITINQNLFKQFSISSLFALFTS